MSGLVGRLDRIDDLIEFHRMTFGGARMDGEGTGQAGAGAGGGAGTGDGTGAAGGTGEVAGALLEGDADGDLNQGGSDGAGGEGQQAAVDVPAIVQQVVKALEGQFDSIADRRVNAILQEIRKGQGQQGGGGTGDGGGAGGGTGTQAASRSTDLRGARLAFREYLGDQITFISAEERSFAQDLGAALLAQEATRGIDDDDRAGRTVAAEVARRVKAMREHYETRTVRALEKRGVLKPKDGQAPAAAGGGEKTAGSEFQAGADAAKTMFAGRLPEPAKT